MISTPLLYQMGLMYVINPPKQVLLILGNVSILTSFLIFFEILETDEK
jgi:hypothetical protein